MIVRCTATRLTLLKIRSGVRDLSLFAGSDCQQHRYSDLVTGDAAVTPGWIKQTEFDCRNSVTPAVSAGPQDKSARRWR